MKHASKKHLEYSFQFANSHNQSRYLDRAVLVRVYKVNSMFSVTFKVQNLWGRAIIYKQKILPNKHVLIYMMNKYILLVFKFSVDQLLNNLSCHWKMSITYIIHNVPYTCTVFLQIAVFKMKWKGYWIWGFGVFFSFF